MATLLASDVHLSARRPRMADLFLGFLAGPARDADALYLLGDVFDEWLGDDDERPPHPAVCDGLARLSDAGVSIVVAHGNHDFLLGAEFAARTGCRIVPGDDVVEIEGEPVLVSHGDELCTRDTEYQAWRRRSRDPENQSAFLALPFEARLEHAAAIRERSARGLELAPEDITDVTPEAVENAMRARGVRSLVHGHTHRPGIHRFALDGSPALRAVLGDWYARDSVLVWDAAGPRLARVSDLEP